MASSSSCLSSAENEAKNHPYQFNTKPGPKGAFEARQVNGGFYVRVDMPGVRPDGLKLKKYSETRTVTFSGKAPIIWENMDSSERVYGGYVVLDRDPLELDIDIELKNGCLRLFFPNADGSLHNLISKKLTHKSQDDDSSDYNQFAATDSMFYDDPLGVYAMMNPVTPDLKILDLIQYIRDLHEKENPPYQAPRPDQMKGCRGGNFIHINPFLLSGIEGVYEHKVVKGDASGQNDAFIYVRIDMPGVGPTQYSTKIVSKGSEIMYEGEGEKESHYDDGGRKYLSMGYLKCVCCKHVMVKDELKDGVLRILLRKIRVRSMQVKK